MIAKLEKMPEWSKRFGAVGEVTKQAVDYNKSLSDAFHQMLESQEEGDARHLELKSNLLHQARLVNRRIADLEGGSFIPTKRLSQRRLP